MLREIALLVLFGGCVAQIVIRAPHDTRRKQAPVAHSQRGGLEIALLVGMGVGLLLLPLVYTFTSLFSFADYVFHPALLAIGTVFMLASLYVFYRSHADLGTDEYRAYKQRTKRLVPGLF